MTVHDCTVNERIRIETQDLELLLGVSHENGRLYQLYYGPKLDQDSDNLVILEQLRATDGFHPLAHEIYSGEGIDNYFETAIEVCHSDYGISSLFTYASHTQTKIDDNHTKTEIVLKDTHYPFTVTLYYHAYLKQNIIVTNAHIQHEEKGAVQLRKYFSPALFVNAETYVLHEFTGDWGSESSMTSQILRPGRKTIQSKSATRSNSFVSTFFELGLDHEPEETMGTVILGHIAWTGNFSMNFDLDPANDLRILMGLNPALSTYYLDPGKVFETPEFIFTMSTTGAGQATRNFHDFAREYMLKDGHGPRMTLLNNWETTYFDFDEEKLARLMKEAKHLGVDMFLLDDGWFGNKYPRVDDKAGLGDWEPMKSKLPNGIPALTKAAKEAGVKFGLWIEPEMVSPKSELMEKHPDWATFNQDRTPYYMRSQLVLDLCNPEVQDYVFGIIDKLKTENPDIAYFKWDCNSMTTNLYSKYLGDRQTNYFYDFTQGLYNVLERIKAKYPDLQMMLCSSGGGRSDLRALEYFTEFWPSDNTDPVERLYVQYGASMVFPIKSTSCHVTEMNRNTSYKFRVDVAMQGKFGYDIHPGHLSDDVKQFCIEAVATYNHLKPAILEGDLYRLVSPYSGSHSATEYISKDGKMFVVFAFDIHPRLGQRVNRLKLQGVDPNAKYLIKEVNLMPNTKSTFDLDGQVVPGSFLLSVGIDAFTKTHLNSRVLELTRQ